jgi:serine/threonine protein kinase
VSQCPDRAEIEGLVCGRLPPDRLDFLERHVDGCEKCRRALEELYGVGSIRPPGPPPEYHPPSDSLRIVIEQLQATPRPDPTPSTAHPETRPRKAHSFLQPTDRPGFIGRIGGYDVSREIGRGGMGVVFEGHDPALKRTVAIKVLAAALAADEAARERFQREAQAAAALEHENIVAIHAIGETDGTPFLVLQYVAGESLAERLAREGRLPFEEVRRIGSHVARGLAAAHAKGLIHRDIKPANILLEAATGRAKIADFGLAKAVDEGGLTRAGMVVGTPEFMSPEQATVGHERTIDARSDLFSLGSVLYAASSGVSPFRADSPFLTLDRLRRDPVPPLTGIDPTLPEWFAATVQRLLMKDPAERIPSAKELADILAGMGSPTITLKETSTPTLTLTRPAPKSRRLWWAAALAGLIAVAAGAIWYSNRDRGGTDTAGPLPDNSTPLEPKLPPRVGFYLSGKAESHRSLADAVAAARDDDVVEIHGDGPFPTSAVRLGGKSLTIRAAPGSRPVLVSQNPQVPESGPLIRSDAKLHLEGLEIRWTIDAPKGTAEEVMMAHCAVVHTRGRLTISHCRFTPGRATGVIGASGRELIVSNCQFTAPDGFGILARPEPAGRIAIEGSQFESVIALSVYTPAGVPLSAPNPAAATVHLTNNTFVSSDAVRMLLNYQRKQSLKVTARRNIFDTDHLIMLMGPLGKKGDKSSDVPRPETMRKYLQSFVEWADDANLYRRGCKYLATTLALKSPVHSAPVDGPVGWAGLWGQDSTQSTEGAIRFRERPRSMHAGPLRLERVDGPTGPVPEKLGADPDQLGPR